MSVADQQQFTDAVRTANAGGILSLTAKLKPAVQTLARLAMSDMLPALSSVSSIDRDNVIRVAQDVADDNARKRINWATWVVQGREIRDYGLPPDEVNDGREFLGCSRLDDAGVRRKIDDALARAGIEYSRYEPFKSDSCCGAVAYAWTKVLVEERRAYPGASLVSNVAAAAHYMLARYHVGAAKATQLQMKAIILAYDVKKRMVIAGGDPEMRSMALTANRPFPPDFAVTNWAIKGTEEGETDRLRCNSKASQPLIAPTVNNVEWGG